MLEKSNNLIQVLEVICPTWQNRVANLSTFKNKKKIHI
jgi:hypothetical protein